MDPNIPVYPDAVTKVLKLLKDNFKEYFKAYYDGDPLQIPKANLPCIIVEGVQGQTSLGATGTDNLGTSLNVLVVFNKEDDYGADDTKDTTEKKLRRVVEARNATTGEFLKDTVIGVLRENITLNQTTLANDVDWTYEIQPRGDQTVTSEARVSIVVTERVFVPNRK